MSSFSSIEMPRKNVFRVRRIVTGDFSNSIFHIRVSFSGFTTKRGRFLNFKHLTKHHLFFQLDRMGWDARKGKGKLCGSEDFE